MMMRRTSLTRSIALLIVLCALPSRPAAAESIAVPAGGDLQEALNRARPGDVISLAAGATYVGNFVLPERDGGTYVIIRTAADGAGLPRAGQRILPAHSAHLAKLKS